MKRVPFTAEPEIPEILSKWKAPKIWQAVPFPWSLAVYHRSLAFRARFYHAQNKAADEEEAASVACVFLSRC